jgi:hypothetical protein
MVEYYGQLSILKTNMLVDLKHKLVSVQLDLKHKQICLSFGSTGHSCFRNGCTTILEYQIIENEWFEYWIYSLPPYWLILFQQWNILSWIKSSILIYLFSLWWFWANFSKQGGLLSLKRRHWGNLLYYVHCRLLKASKVTKWTHKFR